MYIQHMRNKKRDLNGYKKELGRYRLTRKNVLIIEKILWKYADAREMNTGKISKLPEGRRHMPRKVADRHIVVGEHQLDSVKFLPKDVKMTRYMEIACKPGITIKITPRSTTIHAQTHYATGMELMIMKEVVASLEKYLSSLQKSFFNICRFD